MLLASSSSSGGSNFLIPNGTFIFELVMFIIVLGIMSKFILPPLQKAMSDRDDQVRQSLQAGDEGRSEADRLVAERQAVLDAAHANARTTVEAVAREVEELREDAQRRGQQAFEQAIAAAQATIATESAALRTETLSKLEEVVILAAERIIGDSVDPDRHRSVITAAIADANAEGAKQ